MNTQHNTIHDKLNGIKSELSELGYDVERQKKATRARLEDNKSKLKNEAQDIITKALIMFARGWLVMYCWNYIIPELFGLMELNYWQSFFLCWLVALLFRRNNKKD
jgi:cation transport ATPase